MMDAETTLSRCTTAAAAAGLPTWMALWSFFFFDKDLDKYDGNKFV
jgi:hypothetical protein